MEARTSITTGPPICTSFPKETTLLHAVYWPAFLMAAEVPVPHHILEHGRLLFEQDETSKPPADTAYPEPIVKVLGSDALR